MEHLEDMDDATEESDSAGARLAGARPAIKIPDLAAIRVEIEPLDVDDAQIDERLDALRRDYAGVTPVDRPARAGDVVEIDLQAVIDEVCVPDGHAEGVAHQVGSGHVLDGLDEALIGMGPGETSVIATRLVGGRHAGRSADLRVSVKSVFDARIPDLDDEFAQLIAGTGAEQLRESVRSELTRTRVSGGILAARDQAVAALIDAVGPLPVDDLIRADADLLRKLLVDDLRTKGRSLAEYLDDEGLTEPEIDAALLGSASRRLHCHMILDAIADHEGIDVDQNELRAIVMERADRSHAPLRAFVDQLVRTGMVGPIYVDARRQKALGHVLRTVTVTDTTGRTITLGG